MKKVISLLLIIWLVCASSAMGESQRSLKTSGSAKNTFHVIPQSLGVLILDKSIELMTRDGTYIKGKVVRTSPEEITLRVKKAEPKDRITGGEATLRSADISVINMNKAGNPALTVALGIVGGLIGGGAVAQGGDPDAADQGAFAALVIGAMALGATGGVVLGKKLSRKTVVINIERP